MVSDLHSFLETQETYSVQKLGQNVFHQSLGLLKTQLRNVALDVFKRRKPVKILLQEQTELNDPVSHALGTIFGSLRTPWELKRRLQQREAEVFLVHGSCFGVKVQVFLEYGLDLF